MLRSPRSYPATDVGLKRPADATASSFKVKPRASRARRRARPISRAIDAMWRPHRATTRSWEVKRTLEQLRRGCYAVRTTPRPYLSSPARTIVRQDTLRRTRSAALHLAPIVGQPTGDAGLHRWFVTASTSFGRIAITLLRERDMRCRVATTLIGLA